MNLLGLLADTELDSGLLSDLLLEDDDGMLELTGEGSTLTSGTPTAAENDETSSSDDTSGSPGSPAVNSKLEPKRWDKVTDRKAKRRAQVAVSARRHRYRKKHEMLDLRKEVGELTEQLHSLRSKHKLLRPNGQAEEYAMAQRHKRRQSEEMNEQLRRALVMQRRFFNSMQAFVLNSPITNAELNMCSLLHTFTRLGKMPYSRQRDYLALCTDSKADLAVQILLRETEGMNFAGPPSIVTRVVPAQSMQQQIVTTVGAYAFDTLDLKSVFASACDGILGCGTEWPQYKAVSQHGEVKDKPKGNIRYGVSGTSYQRLGVAATQVVSVESRSIIFYRMSTDHGVLVWDFADEDDLYPVKPEATIKLDLTGAAMVRREMCPDGAERVVCRSICTKLQSFSLPPAASEVSYYLQQSAKGAKMCGFAVYNHIREHASQDTMVAV
ncbi:Transportin-3 [Phytophthora boehmeriae]|uniref:Transportin-3 n=1 Tax=Phytophthora boehmeriae TaxID=109152 RepID=A0A8T1X2V4_9STRA|nr:Transportin-3 [Phytophthora boehmeriae]